MSEIAKHIHEAKERGDDINKVNDVIYEARDLLVKLGQNAKNPIEKLTVANLLVPLIQMLSDVTKKGADSWEFLDNYYHAKSFGIGKMLKEMQKA